MPVMIDEEHNLIVQKREDTVAANSIVTLKERDVATDLLHN